MLETGASVNLDGILSEVGEFGRYQMTALLFLSILRMLTGTSVFNYIISATPLNYRCKVPGCDVGENIHDIRYDQPWLHDAIPLDGKKLHRCKHYALKNGTESKPGQCSADMFDKTKQVTCSEYINESDEMNVQTAFNIYCDDDYKLGLIGTAGNVARFIFLPFSGLIADRFGRLPGIIIGTQLSGLFGLLKSLSPNYIMYIACEFLEAVGFTCAYSGIYVLAVEWMSSKYRVLGNNTLSIAYPLGPIILTLVAMFVHDFRWVIRIFAIPELIAFVFFWLIPESYRWLLVTGRVDRAVKIFENIAKTNGKKLSKETTEMIKMQYSTKSHVETDNDNSSILQSIATVFKSRRLSLRFLNACYIWIAITFSYYGVTQSSVQIPGLNRYISMIIVSAIEIPTIFTSQILMSRFRRRLLFPISISIAAISVLAAAYIPTESSWLVLLLMVIGKGTITFTLNGLYIFTIEQWPTNIRSTILNTCSMIGRLGSMVSPIVVVSLSKYGPIPAYLFAGTGILAAIGFLLCPETYGKKFPDTIEEAENI